MALSSLTAIHSSKLFPNGSDHAMIACYLKLYEEGEIKHINGVWPSFPNSTATKKLGYTWHQLMRMRTHPYEYCTRYRIFNP